MRGTQGSLKEWSYSLHKCAKEIRKERRKKSGKKARKCFVAVFRQPENVLKEVDT